MIETVKRTQKKCCSGETALLDQVREEFAVFKAEVRDLLADAARPAIRFRPAVRLGLAPGATELVGVAVSGVHAHSAAERAGLRPGDILVSLAGQPAKSLDSFAEIARALSPRGEVKANVLRMDKPIDLAILPTDPEAACFTKSAASQWTRTPTCSRM